MSTDTSTISPNGWIQSYPLDLSQAQGNTMTQILYKRLPCDAGAIAINNNSSATLKVTITDAEAGTDSRLSRTFFVPGGHYQTFPTQPYRAITVWGQNATGSDSESAEVSAYEKLEAADIVLGAQDQGSDIWFEGTFPPGVPINLSSPWGGVVNFTNEDTTFLQLKVGFRMSVFAGGTSPGGWAGCPIILKTGINADGLLNIATDIDLYEGELDRKAITVGDNGYMYASLQGAWTITMKDSAVIGSNGVPIEFQNVLNNRPYVVEMGPGSLITSGQGPSVVWAAKWTRLGAAAKISFAYAGDSWAQNADLAPEANMAIYGTTNTSSTDTGQLTLATGSSLGAYGGNWNHSNIHLGPGAEANIGGDLNESSVDVGAGAQFVFADASMTAVNLYESSIKIAEAAILACQNMGTWSNLDIEVGRAASLTINPNDPSPAGSGCFITGRIKTGAASTGTLWQDSSSTAVVNIDQPAGSTWTFGSYDSSSGTITSYTGTSGLILGVVTNADSSPVVIPNVESFTQFTLMMNVTAIPSGTLTYNVDTQDPVTGGNYNVVGTQSITATGTTHGGPYVLYGELIVNFSTPAGAVWALALIGQPS